MFQIEISEEGIRDIKIKIAFAQRIRERESTIAEFPNGRLTPPLERDPLRWKGPNTTITKR